MCREIQQNGRMNNNITNRAAVLLIIKGGPSKSCRKPTENLINCPTPRRMRFFIG
jgi:hypothetical protein